MALSAALPPNWEPLDARLAFHPACQSRQTYLNPGGAGGCGGLGGLGILSGRGGLGGLGALGAFGGDSGPLGSLTKIHGIVTLQRVVSIAA